ncbi:Lrp/AsnC family transcriptional regulator [Humibacter soli]
MDALDRKILSDLQENGRTSVTELASNVGLSLSAAHRRLRDLENAGAITGYRADIAPVAVGLTFEAVVFVTMGHTDAATVAEFEDAVRELPNVIQAERLFGEPDYILRVLVENLEAYQKLYDSRLGGLPGVQRLTSTIVMKRIGRDRFIPV